MDTLKELLYEARYLEKKREFEDPHSLKDPWKAIAALEDELGEFKHLPDEVFFGSAADVAGRHAHKQMVEAINVVRQKVQLMRRELEGDVKRLDREISEILDPYR